MFTAIVTKSGEMIFSQDGVADRESMKETAESSGIKDYDIVELTPEAHAAMIVAQTPVRARVLTLQDVVDELPVDIQKRLNAKLNSKR
jgi:hypothetical protein